MMTVVLFLLVLVFDVPPRRVTMGYDGLSPVTLEVCRGK